MSRFVRHAIARERQRRIREDAIARVSAFLEEILTQPQGWVVYHGEFDPGSEQTLAARFKHASRTARAVAIWLLEWRTGE